MQSSKVQVQLHMSRISRQKPLTPRSASPKRFLPPFGIGTPEAESLKQDVRKYVARVRKTSINELLLNFGARFNEIFWRKKKAKQGSWKAWLQTIHGIELDLKASPYPGIACSCASDMYAFLDTLSPVPVAEKDTHNASESWGHAQRSLEKEVRNCLSRNGPTSIDKMQKDFGDRYRAVHPPPWSLRRWLSGLSGVECSFMQLSGQDNADHGMNTDRASKQCYTSTLVLVFNEPRVHSTSSECQHKRKRTKSKHKRSRCHNRSRSHRAHANSRAIRPAVLNGQLVQSSAERPAERPAAAQAVSPVAAVAPKQQQWWQQGHQHVEKPAEDNQQQGIGADAEKQVEIDDTAYKATEDSTSSECQHKRKRSKSKHKRSRCHNRSRSHRKQSRSKRDRSRSKHDRNRSKRKKMRSKQRKSRSMLGRSRSRPEQRGKEEKEEEDEEEERKRIAKTSLKLSNGAAAAAERQPDNESGAFGHSSPRSVQKDLEHTFRNVRTAAGLDTQPGNESAASGRESLYTAKQAIAHKQLKEWLKWKADDGKGTLLQYEEALLREFGSKQELAASINKATPGVSMGQRVDPAVFEALGVHLLGHKLMLVKAIAALQREHMQ